MTSPGAPSSRRLSKLVEESDVAALTLREVARRAGVTHAAPYHHFPNKAALLAVLAEEGYRDGFW